jgi:hypothetical protein
MTRETELRDQLAELRRQRDAGMNRVAHLLAGGSDTAAARAEVAALERRIADTEQRLADGAAQREAATLEAISVAAGLIHAATIIDIAARLRAVQPFDYPNGELK